MYQRRLYLRDAILDTHLLDSSKFKCYYRYLAIGYFWKLREAARFTRSASSGIATADLDMQDSLGRYLVVRVWCGARRWQPYADATVS
eukprot:SAG11_NODE_14506_length_609_cov_1.611765_1_plen_88_part_00